jgi:hypothetical protein
MIAVARDRFIPNRPAKPNPAPKRPRKALLAPQTNKGVAAILSHSCLAPVRAHNAMPNTKALDAIPKANAALPRVFVWYGGLPESIILFIQA